MVLDVDVELGDGGSELRVLVVAIIVSAEMRPRRRHPLLSPTSVRPSLSSTASTLRLQPRPERTDVSAQVRVPNTDDSSKTSGRTSPSIHASTPATH